MSAGDRLDVALGRQRDDELLVVDEVLDVHVADVEGDLASAARSANFSVTSASSFLMTVRSTVSSAEDRLELGDRLAQLGHLVFEVDPAEAGELAELHVEDVLGLHLGELERRGHERRRGRRPVVGDARMVAMIWSMTSTALSRPSTMWARSCAFLRRNSDRRRMTSTWWST